jgi:hypothetical protein
MNRVAFALVDSKELLARAAALPMLSSESGVVGIAALESLVFGSRVDMDRAHVPVESPLR